MNEFSFIARYLRPLTRGFAGSLNLTDDAALLNIPSGMQLAVTQDALVEGVHFHGGESPSFIARKGLRVNLSDLAAMGAGAHCYFLSLILPESCAKEEWLADFARGLAADQEEFGIALAGGDTTRTPGPLSISITALGLVPAGEALTRAGARAGDAIFVSGPLGEAAMSGYTLLPAPRMALALSLRGLATACMDISDGLAQDLGHLCAASGVGAEVRADAVPRLRADVETALTGGDDYELLFTVPAARISDVPEGCTRIGVVTQKHKIRILDAGGVEIPLARRGYMHF